MTRRVLSLNGGAWQLGQAPAGASAHCASWDELEQVTEWLPATVPGNVRADLVRTGRLPDLNLGTQADAAQWVDNHCWWFQRSFSSQPSPLERVHLVLRGVDYISDLFLNGRFLGRHEGMFSPRMHDITPLLEAENVLAVRILGSRWLPAERSSPWLRWLNYAESRVGTIGTRFPQRRDTLKCQMGFGWDFAPPLRTMGIWDDVYAVTSGQILIRDVRSRTNWQGDRVELQIDVTLDGIQERTAELRCVLAGSNFEGETASARQHVLVSPGSSSHSLHLSVSHPRLWWPWDHGSPNLYRLDIEVWQGDQCLDRETRLLGLRRVEWDAWTLYINERRVYARGANWVPADILPGRVTGSDYRQLLSMAREANMNMLRVWGGGLREKRAFYSFCDQMGILVWQEFPLACAFLTRFPDSASYLRLVESETRAIVQDLRIHPSIVKWCGGNEFDPGRNRHVTAVMERVVGQEDGERVFRPASPSGGDSHNWTVWHGLHPPTSYRDDPALFASEFGLQSSPSVEALQKFVPTDELWPPGPSWAYHGAGLAKLWRYASPFLDSEEPTLDQFIEACQRGQANGLQVAIEHYRRAKANGNGGVLVWQFNEPWPAISWALVGFDRQPKQAYHRVKQLMAPLLISLEYTSTRFRAGDTFSSRVWLINDLHQSLDRCRLEVTLTNETGLVVETLCQALDVAADSATVVATLSWRLPAENGWRIACTLQREGQLIATNDYDLTINDGALPTARQRLRAWLKHLLIPA